jgi:hypothetical protein
MTHAQRDNPPLPSAIAGHAIVEKLGLDSYLGHGPGGRKVVLKRLDDDCILKGQLHPAIRDRLERVRELAQPEAANLYGVERQDEAAWLVWEWVAGQTLEAFIHNTRPDNDVLFRTLRQCLDAIESLHENGLVHGAIHERNWIVDSSGQVHLMHISPLLYTNVADDVTATLAMLDRLEQAAPDKNALADLRAAGHGDPQPLKAMRQWLNRRLNAAGEAALSGGAAVSLTMGESAVRRWSLLAAGALVIVGALLAIGLRHYVTRPIQQPLDAPVSAR